MLKPLNDNKFCTYALFADSIPKIPILFDRQFGTFHQVEDVQKEHENNKIEIFGLY